MIDQTRDDESQTRADVRKNVRGLKRENQEEGLILPERT